MRYLETYGISREQLAMVPVIQREWAAKNPRAWFKEQITVDDVLESKMIAYPFTLFMCCPRTDGGGALILTTDDRAKDLAGKTVPILGAGESAETALLSKMEDFTTSRAFRTSGKLAFDQAGISHDDVDHVMIYDAFAHLPLYGLEDLGFCKPGEAADFVGDRHTAPGGKLPVNTSGGGLSYMHSGMYGMYALQEGVRQMRGIAPAQIADANISVVHGLGGMFSASGTIILGSNTNPLDDPGVIQRTTKKLHKIAFRIKFDFIKKLERAMRFELTTSTLARLRSTPELRPQLYFKCYSTATNSWSIIVIR